MRTTTFDDYHRFVKEETAKVGQETDGIIVLSSDDRPLFEICLAKDGQSLEVRASQVVNHDAHLLDYRLSITPISSNDILITRAPYPS